MSAIHLVRLRLRTRAVLRLKARIRITPRGDRVSYLAHVALAELFGDGGPKPFVIDREGEDVLDILGYSTSDAAALHEHLATFALPEAVATLDAESLISKPVPALPAGRRLGFVVRALPVRRFARGSARAGQEVDAFLHACEHAGPGVPVDRDAVYLDWLREQFTARGATLEHGRLTSMQRVRPVRRTQRTEERGRAPALLERPDVRFEGTLVIDDADAFRAGLARGLGRHRAFGYGMVLLRPPEP